MAQQSIVPFLELAIIIRRVRNIRPLPFLPPHMCISRGLLSVHVNASSAWRRPSVQCVMANKVITVVLAAATATSVQASQEEER
jgi:hypothetical protein